MTIDLSANFEDSNSEEWIVTSLLDICSEEPAYGANASSEEFKPEWPRYKELQTSIVMVTYLHQKKEFAPKHC